MSLKKNDILDLDIIDMTNLGFGVAKHEGQVVFISGAVIGEKIRTKIIKCGASFAVGRIENIVSPSPNRTESRCKNPLCKSCAYKCIDYSLELELKREAIVADFKKVGLDGVKIAPIVSSPASLGYRNKAQYPIAKSPAGDYIIGFFAPKSHRVTEAADCPLAPDSFEKILNTLREFFKKNSISVYDEESGRGLLRHVYLRRGEISGEVLLTLVINGTTLPHSTELAKIIQSEHPEIVGLLLNVNQSKTNIILGDEWKILFGRDHIFDTLAGVRLKITAPSFYQVNHDCAELLYAKAKELAAPTKSDTVLDLYCGAGSIGLSMAKDCRELIGIEIVESAVECAKYNAEINGINNAAFYAGDAKGAEGLLDIAEAARGERICPDIVILDPPRAGCDEALLSYIAASLSPKRIVYISCNPTTLARDMAILAQLGFAGDTVTPVDMFPGTGHVESVVCLTRK